MSSSLSLLLVDELVDQLPETAVSLVCVTEGDQSSLLEALARVPDPRCRRGIRHRFTPLLAASVAAMLAGARSFAAIAEWVADLPPAARVALSMCGPAPATSTIWRLLTAVDASALQAALGSWVRARLAELTGAHSTRRTPRQVLALDGKTMRATTRAGAPVHLLGVLDHATSAVVAQVNVDVKRNEISCFATVLDQIEDLTDVLVTADAMHAQTAHINYLHARGAHLLVCVKANQPSLLARLKALPWKDVPNGHTSSGRAHGRLEKRTLKAVTVAAGLGFPHAAQAIQVLRRTRRIKPRPGGRHRWHTETAYAIVTLPAEQAHPAELATWIRQHWHIENKIHWVRDVTLGEDLHQAKTGNGPHVMAILRNLIITLLRWAGHNNIARALRHNARHPGQAITLVTKGLTTSQ